MNQNHTFSSSVVYLPLFSVLSIWIVYWVQIRFWLDQFEWGIFPRTWLGLRGIFFSPFIHGSLEHLWNNSIPLFVLLMALRFFYRSVSTKVVWIGFLTTGLLTWIIARESYHIGASGFIYFLVSFLFFKGIQTKHYRLVALSLAIVMFYGGMIWYIFPNVKDGMSWEGHLAGFVVGFCTTFAFPMKEYQKVPVYDWEKPDYNPELDPFMQHFDENGNFKPKPKPEEEISSYFTTSIKVVYDYVKKEGD